MASGLVAGGFVREILEDGWEVREWEEGRRGSERW